MSFVKVAFPKSPLKALTYSVPDEFPEITPGMRVLVPVGSRFVTGFVIEATNTLEEDYEAKPIADLLDPQNLFSPTLLKLTRWMADYYLAEWVDLLKSALPPGLDVRPETLIFLTDRGNAEAMSHAILQVLKNKQTLPLKQIYELFGHRGTFSQLRMLEDNGLIEIVAEKKAKRAGYNMVEAIRSADPPSAKKEKEIFDYLMSQPGGVWSEDLRKLFKNSGGILKKLSDQYRIRRFWLPAAPKNLWPEMHTVIELNSMQQKAYQQILKVKNKFGVSLLHGVTGSGKTEVYLRLAQDVLQAGKSVLILVPEIALLPLIVHRAEKTLKHPISILHSELTDRERLLEWQRAKKGEVRMVIGARSAIFAPLQNVGLIIIDEEHDGSFKQKEYPRYHARESAIMRATFEKCPIVLGSATPSVETFYNAGNGKYTYLSLPHRVEHRPMPKVELIDMMYEFRETGNVMFSRLLLEQITKRLDRDEQILMLQNRRGYASLLMCRDCGNVLECPNCSVTLTYHKHPNRMRCHYCDYSRLAPSKCEKCGSVFLHFAGVGTEKIVEALRKSYPSARIERFDRDATRQRGSIARILTRFAMREIDILVGTQMLAKGHDFPNVTLVGVVGADSAIGIPDFRASERLFQLITQVAGRSGRGEEPGLVILQTFHPDHYAIRCSIAQSYERFYETEIRFRRLMQYPPYTALANIIFSGKDASKVLEEARGFGKLILAYKTAAMKMLGPAIAPIARLSNLYRFQLLLKSPSRKDLHDCLRSAVQKYDSEGKHHSQYSIDIDPYSIT